MPRSAARPDAAARAGRGVAVAAAILMLGNVLSRRLGLVREQLAAGYFGAGDAIAAFTIADNLQTLLFDLMVSGALQAALIPVLARLVLPGAVQHAELRRVGGALVTWVLLVTGSLALLGIVFAPQLVDGLTWFSGESARGPETRELAVRLVRIVMPAAALLGLGTVLQAMLHALGAVTAPALATAARNVAIIVAMLLLAGALGVESMAWGTLAGAALIVALQLRPLARHNALPVPNLQFRHPAVRRMGALYLPVFAGLLVNAVAVVVDRGLAWGAGELAVGAMRYATTLVQMVLGLVAAATSLAVLPALSRHFRDRDERAFAGALGRVLGVVTVLILPAAAGLAVVAHPIAALLFGHGATGPDGIDAIALALLGYLPGTVAAAWDQVLTFAFYARHNTRVPVLMGLAGVAVYFVAAFGLVGRYGMMGLVIANSLMFVTRATGLWLAMGPVGMRLLDRGVARSVRGATLAAIALAAAAGASRVGLEHWWGIDGVAGSGLPAQAGLVAIPGLVGAVVYVAVLRLMGVRELADLRAALARRFLA
jgi:putative peptidoglycan lipid II flippase